MEQLLETLCAAYGGERRQSDVDVEAIRRGVRSGTGVVLVERGIHSGQYWCTYHLTTEAAATYHDAETYPDDWPIVEAIDVATNERFAAELRTHLVPQS